MRMRMMRHDAFSSHAHVRMAGGRSTHQLLGHLLHLLTQTIEPAADAHEQYAHEDSACAHAHEQRVKCIHLFAAPRPRPSSGWAKHCGEHSVQQNTLLILQGNALISF